MLNSTRCKSACYGSIILMLVFLSSCQTNLKTRVEPDLGQIKSIAVFPFVPMEEGVQSGSKVVPRIQDNASDIMTSRLLTRLSEKSHLTVIPKPALSKNDLEAINAGSFSRSFEWNKSSDAFLFGRIFYYRDRKGGNYSVSDPSRVAFDIRVVRISDGKVIYQCEFDETQEPLLSNLMTIKTFLKRKGHWVKADEMAQTALDDAVDGFLKNKH